MSGVARYSFGITKTTSTAAAAIATLNTTSSKDARIWEVGISVSTAVSGEVGLMRPANTPATPSGGGVGVALDTSSGASVTTIANAWGTAPTAGTAFRRMVLPATIGAGVIWTFPQGLVVPTSAWLVIWQFSALAVTYSCYFEYEE
jgi:hypothetical protein